MCFVCVRLIFILLSYIANSANMNNEIRYTFMQVQHAQITCNISKTLNKKRLVLFCRLDTVFVLLNKC